MADYIDREELIKAIMNDEMLLDTYGTADRWEETIAKINSMPSVDAVEVVRCKDCKHTTKSSADKMFVGKLHCRFTGICVDDDFFCKWGEKE